MEWKPVSKPPEKSGYVLLAGTHHNIPSVMYGFAKIYSDGTVGYKEETYMGRGVTLTHWMPLPRHPEEGCE